MCLPPAPRWTLRSAAAGRLAARLARVLPRLGQKRLVVRHAARAVRGIEGAVLEFGVFTGRSIRQLAAILPDAPIYGFDSFRGFPEDGRRDWTGDFSVSRLPAVPPSVTLVPGFFEETLPGFVAGTLAGGRAPVRLVHVDCDLYSSTRTVFDALAPVLKPGLVIAFDELLHYREFPENEALALAEMLEERGLDFDWMAVRGSVMPFATFCEERASGRLPGPFSDWRARGHYQDAAIRLRPRAAGYEARLARYRDEAERLARLAPPAQPPAAPGVSADARAGA